MATIAEVVAEAKEALAAVAARKPDAETIRLARRIERTPETIAAKTILDAWGAENRGVAERAVAKIVEIDPTFFPRLERSNADAMGSQAMLTIITLIETGFTGPTGRSAAD